MACPPTCGGAATIVVSERFAKQHGLRTDVCILAQALVTDQPDAFDPPSLISIVGVGMTRQAATEVYEDLVKAGVIDPAKVVRIALQDAASVSSLLITTEAMIAEKPKDEKSGGYIVRPPDYQP